MRFGEFMTGFAILGGILTTLALWTIGAFAVSIVGSIATIWLVSVYCAFVVWVTWGKK